jgi:hypothetical protein
MITHFGQTKFIFFIAIYMIESVKKWDNIAVRGKSDPSVKILIEGYLLKD